MQNSRHWFLSDTHFCADREHHVVAFEKLSKLPMQGDTLLLLGDIFEIWVTDDLANEFDRRIEACLKQSSDRGVQILFMHGNRDFMIGKDFAKRTGAKLITDPTLWTLPDGRLCILTHGDWFCTDEIGYKRYRRIVRNPLFQFCFRHLPRKTRLGIAKKIRESSVKAHRESGNGSYDANPELIEAYFQRYGHADAMIMGHTHLPNLHHHDTKPRLVLGDWHRSLWYATASAERGLELFETSEDLENTECRYQF